MQRPERKRPFRNRRGAANFWLARSRREIGEAARSAAGPAETGLADIKARQARQLHELDRHNQQLLVESADVRREFMKKLDVSSLDAFTKTARALSRIVRQRSHRPIRPAPLAPERPFATDLRRTQVHGLRGRDGRFPGRDRLRHLAPAQGHQGGRETPGRRLPARPGGPADATSPTPRSTVRTITSSPFAWPSKGSSHLRLKISTSSKTAFAPFSARPTRSRRRCSR